MSEDALNRSRTSTANATTDRTRTGTASEPGLRAWARKKSEVGTGESTPSATLASTSSSGSASGSGGSFLTMKKSYNELVAEREEEQRKRYDMSAWTRPKTEPLAEANAEFSPVAAYSSKRAWEKRYLFLSEDHLLLFKTKKADNPVALLHMDNFTYDNESEKGKKYVLSITPVRGAMQDLIWKDQQFFISFDSESEYKSFEKAFAAKLAKNTVRKTSEAKPDSSSSISSSSTTASTATSVASPPLASSTDTPKDPDSNIASLATSTDRRSSTSSGTLSNSTDRRASVSRGTTDESLSSSTSTKREKELKNDTKEKKKDARASLSLSKGKVKNVMLVSDVIAVKDASSGSLGLSGGTEMERIKSEVKIVTKKPAIWYNPIVSGCNGILMMCFENKITEIDKNYVDFSWVAASYVSPDAAMGGGAAEATQKKQRFKPRFVVVNPNSTVPTYWESDNTLVKSSDIYKHFVKKFGLKDELYPEDPTKRAAINDVLDEWKLDEAVLVYLRSQLYDKIQNPTLKNAPPAAPVNSVLMKLDSAVTKSNFVVGDHITVADYFAFGDLLVLKQLKFDLSKFTHVLKWMKEMEKLESSATVLGEIDNILSTVPNLH